MNHRIPPGSLAVFEEPGVRSRFGFTRWRNSHRRAKPRLFSSSASSFLNLSLQLSRVLPAKGTHTRFRAAALLMCVPGHVFFPSPLRGRGRVIVSRHDHVTHIFQNRLSLSNRGSIQAKEGGTVRIFVVLGLCRSADCLWGTTWDDAQ